MVTVVRLGQEEKASMPREVTLLGMVTEVRSVQCRKAPLPMDATSMGMNVFLQPASKVLDDVSMMALQLLRESYFALPDSTMIEASLVHVLKAKSWMSVTLLGMVIEVRPLQP